MTTPTTAELLVQEVRRSDWLEFQHIAEQCETLEELKKIIADRLNQPR